MSIAGSEADINNVPRSMFCNVGVDYFMHDLNCFQYNHCWKKIHLEEIDAISKLRLRNFCVRKYYQIKNKVHKLDPLLINWKKNNETDWLYGPVFNGEKDGADGHILDKRNDYLNNISDSHIQVAPKSILKKLSKKQIFIRNILGNGLGYFLTKTRRNISCNGIINDTIDIEPNISFSEIDYKYELYEPELNTNYFEPNYYPEINNTLEPHIAIFIDNVGEELGVEMRHLEIEKSHSAMS